MQIYGCLSQSLTEEAKNEVALEAAQYTIAGVADGLLFFKVIVGLAHVDTRATITVIRTRLSTLDAKISELQDNIVELNEFVKTQQAGLVARGERTSDLLVNLFKAYKACADEEFLRWIKRKEDEYNEGQNITPEELMILAENKYTALKESGMWLQKTADQKRIVALTAQMLTWNKDKLQKKKTDDKKGTSKDARNKGKKIQKGKKPEGKADWFTTPPGMGQPKDKDVNGKDYHWCIHHGTGGKWVHHLPADCEVKKQLEAKGKFPVADNLVSTGKSSGQMKVTGMVAVYPEDDDF
jgi:hypothetical protein